MAGIEASTGAGMPGNWASGLQGGVAAFFDWFMLNYIVPVVVDARNNSVVMLGLLYKDPKTVAGKFFIEPVQDGRNMSGVSAIHSDGNLPDPGNQGGYSYSQSVRDVYARVKIQGKLLRQAMKDGGAFLSPLKYETQGISDDLRIKQEIYLHGDGSGRRGEAAINAPASTVCTVRFNQDSNGIATVTTKPTLYFIPGMRVAFITADGTTVRGNAAYYVKQILSDNTMSLSATLGGTAIASLSATIGYQAGDWIVDASRDSTFSSPAWLDMGWRGEPMGLEGMFRDAGVLDGNGISTAGQQTGANDFTSTSITAASCGFQGIPCNSGLAGYNYDPPDFNKALIFSAGGGAARPISDALLQQMISDIEERNGGNPKWIYSDFGQYNKYVATLIGDKRYNSTQLSGGHTGGVTFNGMEWIKSRFALGNRCGMLDPEMIDVYEQQALAPITTLGTTQWQQVKDKDSVYMAMMTSYNLFVQCRNRLGGQLVDLV